MGNLTEHIQADSRTVRAIYESHKTRGVSAARQECMDASSIGTECSRALWYTFRHCDRSAVTGLEYASRKAGGLAVSRLSLDLTAIGCEVHDENPETGHPFTCSAVAGHFGGQMDGCCRGIPEAPMAWHAIKYASHDAKAFKKLARDGVLKTDPEGYAECMVHMHFFKMKRALYLAVNRKTGELYSERIRYDKKQALALNARAEIIVSATVPPAKLSDERGSWQCRSCSFKMLCHGSEPPIAAVSCVVGCRNCVHSTPEMDMTTGRWSCAKYSITLSREQQDTACTDHLFIPDLINFAEPIGAEYDPVNGDWTEYKNHADGATWRQGRNTAEGHYTSQELTLLPGPLVAAGEIELLTNALAAEFIRVRPHEDDPDWKAHDARLDEFNRRNPGL